ncbi:3 beta-hydroxysteroid dehydrogenase type 7 [Macrosteles quadrilineatus]|uniref:3 beta-hydroxysteroid dehydrogenase type 7 n=1 Tax=Macrosteles quadrilineatus TaxID=74068 RepID=UPI0023E2C1B4|nr:3 beta-hydroxysteroid dehydrogenase type 7 [Macrosteles quadrilineatus]
MGGSGFLGQHIVRELQERDPRVTEIRVLDLLPYNNRLGHEIKKPIVSIVGDITAPDSCKNAFRDVDCVIHCAALVTYDYPSDLRRLQNINVQGTRNVIKLCIEMNIPRLVFTSTSEVTLVPLFKRGFFAAVVHQTETKAGWPKDPTDLVFSDYASTKLQAERIILQAHGTPLKSGLKLRTVALRPTPLYGEEDRGLLPRLMSVADQLEGTFPRISGPGGKHQLTYAGNAAWAHVCAKDSLLDSPTAVGGLSVFVTDDSPITDVTKFCVHLTTSDQRSPYKHSWWYLPSLVSYFLALLLEPILTAVYGSMPFRPSAAVTFLASIVLYSRLRADTHLRYSPVYTYESVRTRTIKYYIEEARLRASHKKLI